MTVPYVDVTAIGAGGSVSRAISSPLLIELPRAGRAARRLAERTGATVVPTALPLGVEATNQFIETVAAEAGPEAEAAAGPLIEAELLAFLPAVEQARGRFLRDRRVAVAADPALAAGLVSLLAEQGVAVPTAAAHTRAERRLPPLRAALASAASMG